MPPFKTPKSGTLPKRGKKVLALVYRKERTAGMGKKRAAKIAWGAVKKSRFKKDGMWHKTFMNDLGHIF